MQYHNSTKMDICILSYFFIIISVVIYINFSQKSRLCLICDIPHTVWNLADQVTIVVYLWQSAEKTWILSAGIYRYALCCSSPLEYLTIYQDKCTATFHLNTDEKVFLPIFQWILSNWAVYYCIWTQGSKCVTVSTQLQSGIKFWRSLIIKHSQITYSTIVVLYMGSYNHCHACQVDSVYVWVEQNTTYIFF